MLLRQLTTTNYLIFVIVNLNISIQILKTYILNACILKLKMLMNSFYGDT